MRKRNPGPVLGALKAQVKSGLALFYSYLLKKNMILAPVKRVRKNLFKTIAIGAPQHGRKIRFNSEYSKDSQ